MKHEFGNSFPSRTLHKGMHNPLDRRAFVVGSVGAIAAAHARQPEQPSQPYSAKPGAWPGFPQQSPDDVRDFVGASHNNLAKIREMLGKHPALAKCSYDGGYGDWESALGAASHVGQREIALLLIEHGARLDIFAATMLGMVDAVRAMVAAQPGIERTPGPHGIPLADHARAGKNEAMIAYVATLEGASRPRPPGVAESEMPTYLGTYAGTTGTIEITKTRFGMAIKAQGGFDRTLYRVGEHQFHPVGAPNVRVNFTLADGKAVRLEVVEAEWYASATRA